MESDWEVKSLDWTANLPPDETCPNLVGAPTRVTAVGMGRGKGMFHQPSKGENGENSEVPTSASPDPPHTCFATHLFANVRAIV